MPETSRSPYIITMIVDALVPNMRQDISNHNGDSSGSIQTVKISYPLHWRHNDQDGVSNHQPHQCLLNRLLVRRSKKTSKLRVTGLCAGNSPETGGFPVQMASNAENVSIWWRHHDCSYKHIVVLMVMVMPLIVALLRQTVVADGLVFNK